MSSCPSFLQMTPPFRMLDPSFCTADGTSRGLPREGRCLRGLSARPLCGDHGRGDVLPKRKSANRCCRRQTTAASGPGLKFLPLSVFCMYHHCRDQNTIRGHEGTAPDGDVVLPQGFSPSFATSRSRFLIAARRREGGGSSIPNRPTICTHHASIIHAAGCEQRAHGTVVSGRKEPRRRSLRDLTQDSDPD